MVPNIHRFVHNYILIAHTHTRVYTHAHIIINQKFRVLHVYKL